MRTPILLAFVAAAAALIGGVVGSVLAHDSGGGGQTVVVRTPASTTSTEAGQLASAPIPRSRFDPARIYARRAAGVVTIYSYFGDPDDVNPHAAQGSGFVVSRRGNVLTNAHVITTAPSATVQAAKTVYVEFEDGDRAPAHVVGYDLFSDVGLLKVDLPAQRLMPVPLGDSSRVVVGEPVAAIGTPFGRQSSLTVGVVSGTRRSISSLTSDYAVADAIQTDAPINRGNSGGPLFDAAGRVIGINAQIRSESGINEGVGFAVPINAAKHAIRDLLADGQVHYAYVGISAQDLTPAVAQRLGYAADYGALVACVTDGGPSERAGLRGGASERAVLGRLNVVEGGDVIVGVNGERVRSGSDLVRIVSEQLRPGRAAVFSVVRGTDRRRMVVRPAERPSKPSTACRP